MIYSKMNDEMHFLNRCIAFKIQISQIAVTAAENISKRRRMDGDDYTTVLQQRFSKYLTNCTETSFAYF